MTRLLIATDSRFWKRRHGTHQRIDSLIRVLRRAGVDVHLYFAGRLTWADADALFCAYPDLDVRAARGVPHARATRRQRLIFRVASWRERLSGGRERAVAGRGRRLASFHSRPDVRAFGAMARNLRPNVVLVEFVRLGYLLEALRGSRCRPMTIVDTIDVMHQRCDSFESAGETPALSVTRDEEASALAEFDVTMAIQRTDAETLRKMLPGRPVITVGIAPALVAPVERPDRVRTVIFMGGASPANVRSLQTLFSDIWPQVLRQAGSRARLDVYGDVAGRLAPGAVPPGVRLAGFIDDLEAMYAGADVVVNPVGIGGGLKIKNVEALCHGKPLVTTPLGAEGLEDGAGTAFLVGSSPVELTTHLSGLIDDDAARRELGRRAFAYASEHFNESLVYGELLGIVEGCSGQAGKKNEHA